MTKRHINNTEMAAPTIAIWNNRKRIEIINGMQNGLLEKAPEIMQRRTRVWKYFSNIRHVETGTILLHFPPMRLKFFWYFVLCSILYENSLTNSMQKFVIITS